jgi:hypothetical protein
VVINGNKMKRYILTITDSNNNIIDVIEGVENINKELEGVEEFLDGCETYEDFDRERTEVNFEEDEYEY